MGEGPKSCNVCFRITCKFKPTWKMNTTIIHISGQHRVIFLSFSSFQQDLKHVVVFYIYIHGWFTISIEEDK
jgi:hypothetical protein